MLILRNLKSICLILLITLNSCKDKEKELEETNEMMRMVYAEPVKQLNGIVDYFDTDDPTITKYVSPDTFARTLARISGFGDVNFSQQPDSVLTKTAKTIIKGMAVNQKVWDATIYDFGLYVHSSLEYDLIKKDTIIIDTTLFIKWGTQKLKTTIFKNKNDWKDVEKLTEEINI